MEITPDLLRSLKALAENPGATPAEQTVAREKLEKLAAKAGIHLDDLTTEEVKGHVWYGKLKSYEVRLAIQVLGVIQDKRTVSIKYLRSSPKRLHYWATEAQAIEFSIMFPHYLKAFRKSLNEYIVAFIHGNDLFSSESHSSAETLSPEELERLMKIARMAKGITPTPRPHKQLKAG
jgi:hypothetical protein